MSAKLALPDGALLNEYRIESTLGVGGFGVTYLATDLNLDLKVALKEYLPGGFARRNPDLSVEADPESARETFEWGLRRFVDESRALASFRHPNIVRVMRYFQANRTAYMVMEFVAGESLATWIRTRRPLPEAAVLGIALPLLEGLDVIHRGRFLHRDIKPPNIFMREDGSPVLLDFGAARAIGGDSDLTAVVTPGYAPFEQYHSHGKQGPWSDLYALGALLYWMVIGKPPVEAAARVKHDVMVPALEAGDRSRYGAALLSAIDWALKPDEADRPQSVAALLAVLPRSAGGEADPRQTAVLAAASVGSAVPEPAPATGTRLVTTASFDGDDLRRLADDLAAHVGPIARVLVKKAAKLSGTMVQLAERVAAEIPDEKERAAFIRRHAAAGGPSAPAANSGRPTGAPSTPTAPSLPGTPAVAETRRESFDPALLARAEADLAPYIGAVARIVVRRAAAKARDTTEFYLLLADQIEDRSERKAYIRRAIAASGAGG